MDWSHDVAIIDLGTNEWGPNGTPSTSAATFKTRLRTLITALKATGDVILVTSNSYDSIDYSPYNQAKFELADSNDIPLIDIYNVFGSYALSNPLGLYADSAHLTAAGYAIKERTLANAIDA